jgi:predicted dithiol-disulfide oxidoreductase (DUF899 family)
MRTPPTVTPQEWTAAREALLVKEKGLTRARDALAAERRRMPRMAVEKDYAFEGPDGPASLLDMFEGRRQLIISTCPPPPSPTRVRAMGVPASRSSRRRWPRCRCRPPALTS